MDSQSIEGAKMVAKYVTTNAVHTLMYGLIFPCRFFQKLEDFASALQFLVLSNCNSEAYTMAEV